MEAAPTIKVSVKWNKQVFEEVELNLADDIATFKGQVYALSNVPVEKQKLMAKGKILKDETAWTAYPGVKDGAQITLMGTAAGGELKDPAKKIQFVEDMTAEQKAKALREKTGVVIPAGLENLGNTCYMNSVMQCLKRVDELKGTLKTFELDESNQGLQNDPNVLMTSAARNFFNDLDNKGESFPPMQFVQTMRTVFPQFNETDDHGHHKQQDADECYTQFLTAFQQALKYAKKQDTEGDAEMLDDETAALDPVTRLFEIELESTTQNTESEAEPETVGTEKVLKLSCHIDNNNNPIDNLQDGLDVSLTGQLEKFSQILQRNAVFKKKSLINKLPSYLCIQFVRFYWKKESNVGGTKAGKAKILRSVMYPRVFDAYNFCSPELKKSLDHGREFDAKLREEEDKMRLEGLKKAEEDSKPKKENETEEEAEQRKKLVGQAAKKQMKEEEDEKHDKALYRPHGRGLDTGNYELVAVVTHKGRSADGGHYVGWVHSSGDTWLCFDDDIVTSVKSDDILALRGGGDWHTAYLCIYRKLEATKE